MAIESHPRCDVFREKWGEDVKEHQIIIQAVDPSTSGIVPVDSYTQCLSPDAVERLKKLVKRGLTPPAKRAVKPK